LMDIEHPRHPGRDLTPDDIFTAHQAGAAGEKDGPEKDYLQMKDLHGACTLRAAKGPCTDNTTPSAR